MIARRRAIRDSYRELLADLAGVTVTADPPWGTGNAWLTTVTFEAPLPPGTAERVRLALAAQRIESRPIWKPMHQQPVFQRHESHVTGVADRVFEQGLCLPSGVGLTDDDISRVAAAVRAELGQPD